MHTVAALNRHCSLWKTEFAVNATHLGIRNQ